MSLITPAECGDWDEESLKRPSSSSDTEAGVPLYQKGAESRPELAVQRFVLAIYGKAIKTRPFSWLYKFILGPVPPKEPTKEIEPFIPRLEAVFDRMFLFIYGRYWVQYLFLIGWFLGFVFLVRQSSFVRSTSEGNWYFVSNTDNYWLKNAQCGLDGSKCLPFADYESVFRCPANSKSVQLLNNYTIGSRQIDYAQLVVGGFDANKTYRSDSWFCAAALQQGLFSDDKGGCAKVSKVGSFSRYVGGNENGIQSYDFDSAFPSSFRLTPIDDQSSCKDLRDPILGYNVAMSFIYSWMVRPSPLAFFWVLVCLGFWHVSLASDPRSSPPDIPGAFQDFLPGLFICYGLWRSAFRYVLPAFRKVHTDKTILYLGGFWVGVLSNISLDFIPIDRLGGADISSRPTGVIALVIIVIVVFLLILNQVRVIRNEGRLAIYLFWYAIGAIIIGIGSALPTLILRIHHYFLGLIFIPGCAFVTRGSGLFQGFLMGLFLNGGARWGYASIWQTASELVGDGTTGSSLPSFVTNATSFAADPTMVYWNALPERNSSFSYTAFTVLVDDVVRYMGTQSNLSLAQLSPDIPHYIRVAYSTASGSSGDFTKAATVMLNGTFIPPEAGAT